MTADQVKQYTQFVLLEVLAVEQVITSPQAGQTKLQLVINSIESASSVGAIIAPNPMISAYSALIEGIVGALNSSGVFSHTSTPSPGK